MSSDEEPSQKVIPKQKKNNLQEIKNMRESIKKVKNNSNRSSMLRMKSFESQKTTPRESKVEPQTERYKTRESVFDRMMKD
jgi:hypothetical protein